MLKLKAFAPHLVMPCHSCLPSGKIWWGCRGARQKLLRKPRPLGRGAGFTLIETIVVVVIISILAVLATNNYSRAMEKTRVAEAITMLGAIRAANIRHKAETGAFATNMGDLNLNYTPLKFFTNESPCNGSGVPASCPAPNIGQVQRNANILGQYWFRIDEAANIRCYGLEADDCSWLH